ncbi:hypothetical protein HPB50_028847 [Hyalomma asiaticum]|nr:hypothetical protein HPB50_028847 [Hyalomma asiaticum]
MPQKGERGEHRADLTINVTGKTGPITAIKTGENYEAESVHSIQPLAKNCDVATSTLVLHPSSIEGDHRVITVEKRRPRGLTETDVSNIVRHMRQLLQNKGPSQEQELVEAVTSLHADLALQMHGRMRDLRNRCPAFVVINEDRCSSVYCEHLDGDVQDDSTSRMKHEAITGPSSAASIDDQVAAVFDGEPHRECATISSSRPANESITEGEHQEREEHSLKDIDVQVTSLPRSLVRKGKSRSDAKRQGCRVFGIAEAKSTKQTYDLDVVQLQKQETLKSSTYEVARQRANVHRLPPAPQTRITTECTFTKEEPHLGKREAHRPKSDSR